jgi:hypothetical protein
MSEQIEIFGTNTGKMLGEYSVESEGISHHDWYNQHWHNGKYGENVTPLEGLFIALKEEIIDEYFFSEYSTDKNPDDKNCDIQKLCNFCPISIENGYHCFFGNFENLSYVFSIRTKDQRLINKLTTVIKNNGGWALYYKKNLVDSEKT